MPPQWAPRNTAAGLPNTSLRYRVQPGPEGHEGEAGPVQLRFDLVSLSG